MMTEEGVGSPAAEVRDSYEPPTCMLAFELWSSIRASVLNHRAISIDLVTLLKVTYKVPIIAYELNSPLLLIFPENAK